MRVERGIPRYRSAQEIISSGALDAYRSRDVAVRSAAGYVTGGLKVLVDSAVIAFVDVAPGADEVEECAAIWAHLAVHARE